jgi:hypothetical protein
MSAPLHRRVLRHVERTLSAWVAVLLAGAVLAATLRAGSEYIYCVAMQEVMPHACCMHSHAPDAGSATLTTAVPDCCQARTVPAFGNWTPGGRAIQLTAPVLVAVLAPFASVVRARPPDEQFVEREPGLRTGPPIARRLAQLMTLHI